jgi:parallel beta-helix repeat protein
MNLVNRILCALCIILFIFNLIFPTIASEDTVLTLYVGGNNSGNYSTIQKAIENASNGSIIYVYNGTYFENIVLEKSITLRGENKNGVILSSAGLGNTITIKNDRVTVSGFSIKNGQKISWVGGGFAYLGAGIRINSNYSNVSNNIIFNNSFGILIENGFENKIYSNKIFDNGDGMKISGFNNTIEGNIIEENNKLLIWDEEKSSNTGIILNAAYNSVINNNNISENKGTGINVSVSSTENIIYHNNFINNTINAFDDSNNSWDNGVKGNYWSDYEGIDENYDEIGDTPYLIAGGDNKDNYPLMKPYKGEYEFIVDEEIVYRMLVYGMIAVIIFLLPIGYFWYKKHHKKN